MPFKSIVREMKDGIGNISIRGTNRRYMRNRGRSHIAPERCPASTALIQQTQWANLPPELLLDIIQRLEASETSWPARRDVVACAAVCRSWRDITKEVVKTPEKCGWLTFPISLKQVTLLSFVFSIPFPLLFLLGYFLKVMKLIIYGVYSYLL